MFCNCDTKVPYGKSIIALLIIYLLAIAGCRVLPPVISEVRDYTGVEIYEELLSREPEIKTYSAGRVLINIIDDDQVTNIRGAVRIRKDSAIMISVSVFAGIEAARIMLTNDSVKIIDRINNIYFSGTYKDSGRFLPVPVNYNFVQGLFFASAVNFIKDPESIKGDEKKYTFDNDRITFQMKTDFFSEHYNNSDIARFSLDQRLLIRDVDFLSDDKNMYANLNYSSFNYYDGFYFPGIIEMYYLSHNLPLKATLRIGRIELNRDFTFPFSVPERYKRVKN